MSPPHFVATRAESIDHLSHLSNTELTWLVAGGSLLLSILYIGCKVVYELYFSPIRHIPGPKLAAISDYWLFIKLQRLEKCPTIHRLHEQYGPTVRIGPNNVAFRNFEIVKQVYNAGSPFDKSSWYLTWSLCGLSNIFTLIDRKTHGSRRRITAQLMAHKNLIQFLPDINQHVRSFVSLCHQKKKMGQRQIDLVPMYRYFALDVLSSATFGKSFRLLETGQDHHFSTDLDNCVDVLPLRGYMPAWVWSIVRRYLGKHWQYMIGAERRLCDYGELLVKEQQEKIASNGDKPNIIRKYLEHRLPDGKPLAPDVITGEIADLFFAGTDTTSTTLTFITWAVVSRPHIQERLFKELKEHMPNREEPELEDIMSWPYLRGVIHEGLRIYTPVPSHMERIVPPEGAMIDGYHVPGGTIVGAQMYTLNRDTTVFPYPEEFAPERWLPENETEAMRRTFIPSSIGARNCLGQHIAMLEMRLILAAVFRHFRFVIPVGFDPKLMDMKDKWNIFPVGHTLPLEPVERED